MLIALVAIFVFFSIASPTFVSARNLSNLAVELSITAVLALGMLMIIVTSQMDLSVGSGVGLFGGLAAVLTFEQQWPAPAAMALSLVVAIGVWTMMGAIIVKQRVPAFIITLAGLLVFKGLHWLVIHNETIPIAVPGQENAYSLLTTYFVPKLAGYVLAGVVVGSVAWMRIAARRERLALGLDVEPAADTYARVFLVGQLVFLFVILCNQYRGVPLPAVILGVTAFVVWVVTQHTRFGRYLYAIGGNEEAARISGIAVDRVVIGAFAAMGGIVALTGFMQTAYSGASTTTVGSLMELDAIAACVIGGTSLRGGRGTVTGVLFGALIMASLLNGMTLMAVSPEIKLIARGLVLAVAVWMDVRLARS
ncbi:MAG: ATPase [Deltaproteobacteria bacterium]|nr:ATPase [Deltaproteobacteria bacterium]